ncbi:conserved exported protein of unknown function [Tenacibaculum sp. 190130A14a]|uniref:YD repeat-containing protein n=1 Tax=Tenacibaculum polynesiense TaxID=3137857 RepID=A0ABP1F504_9FLAO
MKKGILLLLGMMTIATMNANNITKSTSKLGVTSRYNDAVTFVERGVQFHVFLNGDFDFNTHHRNTRYFDYYGKRMKTNRGVRIERDRRGRVRRVGNTFINYDARGNVKRIGSVYMRYRFGQLTDVGNLRIRYDRWGNPRFYGNVKYNDYCEDDVYYNDGGIDIDINIGDVFDYDDVYFYRRDFRNNYRQFREDDNFFYYRAVPNAKIGKRSKVLKRRKPKKRRDDIYFKANPNRADKSNRRSNR